MPSWLKSRTSGKNECKSAANEAVLEVFAPKEAQNVTSLSQFIRDGWHVLEPTTPLEWNWHIDAVADHLQAAAEDWMAIQRWRSCQQSEIVTKLVGVKQKTNDLAVRVGMAVAEEASDEPLQRIQNLLINIPPGTAKSRIVSVFFPAWVWLKWPSFRFIFLSSNPRVAERDSVYCRDVVESEWYRDTFKVAWRLRPDANGKRSFWNTAGGFRSAFGFFSRITGDRADAIVVDDPHDADEVHSDNLRQGVLDRWDGAVGNRVNDLRSSLRIGVMQRLHEADWSGHVLGKRGWIHLCLPMEYETVGGCGCESCVRPSVIGWKDPRTKEGELLFSKRYTPEVLESEKTRLGSAGYAGQMQQKPATAGGEIFKTLWWQYWVPKGVQLPPVAVRLEDGSTQFVNAVDLPSGFDEEIQSWDMAFKDTKASDYVAGGVWARLGSWKFLLDQVCDRMSFTKTVKAVEDLTALWPEASRKLIEGKANGPAVMSALAGKIAGMIEVEPDGSKIARAHAVTPDIESGDVFIPHPDLWKISGYKRYVWVNLFLAQVSKFPRATNDDQVDQMTQALNYFRPGKKRKGTFT